MLTEPTGRVSRTTREGPRGNQPDDGDCVVCGDPADGVDAGRPGNPSVCRQCAKIRTDGSRSTSSDLPQCRYCGERFTKPYYRNVHEAEDCSARGDGVETDGGEDQFSIRVGEIVRQVEEEVADTTKAEAMLYARCCAAFEHAYNETDLPAENALGVMTAALFEATDRSGYDRVDVIESAREFVDDDVDRGDGPVTDGGKPTKFDEWTLLEVEWDCITRRAKSRFLDQWEKREDWKNFEARYHLYKAHDQLSVASYHSRQDDAGELVKTNVADAVNHMLMAMATLDVDTDECQPVTEQDVVDRGDEIVTDGGEPVASTGGGRHAPAMGGSTTERTYAHYCDEVGSTVYAPRRKCPLECYRDDDDIERGDGVETDGGLLTGGSVYHVVCSDCTFEELKRERHHAARAVDIHRRAKPSHDARFEQVTGR